MGRKKTLERSLLVFISWIFFSRIPFGIYAETSFAIPQKGPSKIFRDFLDCTVIVLPIFPNIKVVVCFS